VEDCSHNACLWLQVRLNLPTFAAKQENHARRLAQRRSHLPQQGGGHAITCASVFPERRHIATIISPVLPEIEHVWMIIVAGCLLASRHQRYIRYTGFTVLFFAWGLLAALQAIWPTQHLPGANRQVRVVITGTDHATTHYADITHLDGKRHSRSRHNALRRIFAAICVRWSAVGYDYQSAACTWATQ
jgi:hypothetical protein